MGRTFNRPNIQPSYRLAQFCTFRQIDLPRKDRVLDPTHFDRMTRSLTDASTRRSILTRLAGAAFAAVAIQLPSLAKARKKKRKKPSVNAFGCLNVGQACGGNDGKCCSGICEGNKPKKGKKDKSRCIAHHTSSCQATDDFCEGTVTGCGTGGACARTTGQASFCAMIGGPDACTSCRGDWDCEPALGPGAACIVCAAGCPVGQHTACVLPDLGTAI